MFRRKKGFSQHGNRSGPAEIVGFLGEGASIEGQVALKGDFKVDGRIVGRITSPSSLIVGPTGEVIAEELRARALSVSGSVTGELHVDELLDIQPGGKVAGRVRMKRRGLVIAPGGEFDGVVEIAETGQPPREKGPAEGRELEQRPVLDPI